ncbi:MAG: glycoside hydrolase family 99-like domain-containing protein [Opitutaceae bacterium]
MNPYDRAVSPHAGAMMLWRRLRGSILCLAAGIFIGPAGIRAADRPPPVVGAIRWDGWFAGSPWAKNLVPAAYHERLPFYTTWEKGEPIVNADDQGVMDREIILASRAGLAYWAFVYYHPSDCWPGGDAYNYGLRRYLASGRQGELHFCLDLQGAHLGRKENWPKTVATLVDFFRKPTYQRVLGNRPLVYLFYWENLVAEFGSIQQARAAIAALREQTEAAGQGNPYIVVQTFSAGEAAAAVDKLGLDASGAYCTSTDGAHQERRNYPFRDLMGINADYWESCKATGKDVVPILNAGWDVRPRWQDAELMKQYHGSEQPYYTPPTASELTRHVQTAIDWITANPESAKAQAILIYAWNESDEGGWLVPTLTGGNARLDAIRSALQGKTVSH